MLRRRKQPATATERARAAFEALSTASLRYFEAIAPDIPADARRRVVDALGNGGRVMTAISVKDGAASVLVSVFEADGTALRVHYLDADGAVPAPAEPLQDPADPA